MSFLNSCRCCLETSDEVKIPLGTIYENGTIIELIKSITNIEISENDGLPQEICSNCLKGFLTAEEIKMQFIKSDNTLRGLLEIKTEIQVDEVIEIDKEILEEFIMDINDDIIIEEPKRVEIKPPVKTKRKRKKPKVPKPPKPANEDVVCEICDLKIRNKHLLSAHIKEHIANNDEPLFQCPNCDLKFYTYKSINFHNCVLKKICYYCNTQFPGITLLLKHMKENHCEFDSFLCNYENCNYQVSRADTIFYHLSNHYAPLEILCEICSMKFTHFKHFSIHRRKHATKTVVKAPLCCDLCGVYIRLKCNMQRHMLRKHMNQRYYCDQCTKFYTDPSTLKFHKVREHQMDSEFKCKKCNSKFVHKSQLIIHEKKLHRTYPKNIRIGYEEGNTSKVKIYDLSDYQKDGDNDNQKDTKKFYCEVCSIQFASRQNLLRHHKIVHLKLRKYSCTFPECNKSFGEKVTRDIHMRIHSKEKPYQCPQCQYSCSDPSTLSKHMKNIHKIQKPSIRMTKALVTTDTE